MGTELVRKKMFNVCQKRLIKDGTCEVQSLTFQFWSGFWFIKEL